MPWSKWAGVHVRPGRGRLDPAAAGRDQPAPRRLRLIAQSDPSGTSADPAFGFALEERGIRADLPLLPAPTLVLQRGQPVSIMVVNQLPEPTAVHWHGIELESYYDGVAGFAGSPGRISPAIAPRDSFNVKFTPPRAGTFIYHTHVDELRQQRAGLAGPLIVADSLSAYDPETNIVLILTTARTGPANGVLLNGSATPAARELRAGTRYRVRIINVHTSRPSMRVEFRQDSTLLAWRALAKDGAELPAERATVRPSSQQLGNGETYDFEFVPGAAGPLRIDVTTGAGALLLSMPVRVR